MKKQLKNKAIAIFEGQQIRRHWDEEKELWYFSVVDVVGVLSASDDPRNYWKVLKSRLKQEGSELVTKCNQLKMRASDGKFYLTDAVDTEVMLRLVQSIPSPNAEPFKLWLARVGMNDWKKPLILNWLSIALSRLIYKRVTVLSGSTSVLRVLKSEKSSPMNGEIAT
jgi:hypothetical protein